jgi:hypothetical protein
LWHQKESLRVADSELRSHQIEEYCKKLFSTFFDKNRTNDEKAVQLSEFLSEIIMDKNNDNLINEIEIEGGLCNLESAVMSAVLKSNATQTSDQAKIHQMTRLAMELNEYKVFEKEIKNVSG